MFTFSSHPHTPSASLWRRPPPREAPCPLPPGGGGWGTLGSLPIIDLQTRASSPPLEKTLHVPFSPQRGHVGEPPPYPLGPPGAQGDVWYTYTPGGEPVKYLQPPSFGYGGGAPLAPPS
jgi:hypothetical protein